MILIALRDPESAGFVTRFFPGYIDVTHTREARTLAGPRNQAFDDVSGPLRDDLDAAVGQIPDPPVQL